MSIPFASLCFFPSSSTLKPTAITLTILGLTWGLHAQGFLLLSKPRQNGGRRSRLEWDTLNITYWDTLPCSRAGHWISALVVIVKSLDVRTNMGAWRQFSANLQTLRPWPLDLVSNGPRGFGAWEHVSHGSTWYSSIPQSTIFSPKVWI